MISQFLTLAVEIAVLCENVLFYIVLPSAEVRFFNLLKKLFVFQKMGFKVQEMKTFKLSCNCQIQIYQSLKRMDIFECPSSRFLEELSFFLLS